MMRLFPTRTLLINLARRRMTWTRLARDLGDQDCHPGGAPVAGYKTRRMIEGEEFKAYVEPYDEKNEWLVVGAQPKPEK